jgi:glycosyltransferase involved in cell wall biosynthesis
MLSVVIPVFNEEGNVEELHRRVVAAVEPVTPFEAIFVDDGSHDDTFALLEALAARDPRVKVLKLRRNYGQTPAMVAGVQHSSGDVVMTMDGDLQNDPADIPEFLRTLELGYDIVVGWRKGRKDSFLKRTLPSRIANRLIAWVTGLPIKDNGCSLKAFRAELIRGVPLYSEMHRFIPAMASLAGARIAQIPVRHHPRTSGRSKYGLNRIYKVALDIVSIKVLVTAHERPIRLFGGAALVAASVSAASGVAALTGHYPALAAMAVLSGLLAVVLLLFGVFAELLARCGDIQLGGFARLAGRRG